jgi:hypothetical protein
MFVKELGRSAFRKLDLPQRTAVAERAQRLRHEGGEETVTAVHQEA